MVRRYKRGWIKFWWGWFCGNTGASWRISGYYPFRLGKSGFKGYEGSGAYFSGGPCRDTIGWKRWGERILLWWYNLVEYFCRDKLCRDRMASFCLCYWWQQSYTEGLRWRCHAELHCVYTARFVWRIGAEHLYRETWEWHRYVWLPGSYRRHPGLPPGIKWSGSAWFVWSGNLPAIWRWGRNGC